MNFKNKVVLVTGSSRGIGRSIAVKFAKEGANVIINYKSNTKEAEVITEIISSYGNKCLCIQADVSNDKQVKSMIEKIIKEFGKIDVVVNNAGIAIDMEFNDREVRDWHDTLNTNLIGVFLVSKYAGNYMKEKQYGKIINISSTNGIDTIYPESIDYDGCFDSNTSFMCFAEHGIKIRQRNCQWICQPYAGKAIVGEYTKSNGRG